MLIPNLLRLKLLLIVLLVNILENVLESTIILLQDRILSAHIQWKRLAQSKLKTGMREALNRFIGIVLRLRNSTPILELENLDFFWLAALGCEDHLECAIALNYQILCAVLVSECVTADDDGLLPSWH